MRQGCYFVSTFRACSHCLHFATRHGSHFLFHWFLGFLVSGSLGFSVSWFLGSLASASLGFWVSWFLGLLVSRFLGFSVPWLLRLLVSGFLGFWVSWFARFPAFLLSEFLVFVLNVTP